MKNYQQPCILFFTALMMISVDWPHESPDNQYHLNK